MITKAEKLAKKRRERREAKIAKDQSKETPPSEKSVASHTSVSSNLAPDVVLKSDVISHVDKSTSTNDVLEGRKMLFECKDFAVATPDDQDVPDWTEARKIILDSETYLTTSSEQVGMLRQGIEALRRRGEESYRSETVVTKIIEFCCDPNSSIGEQGEKIGIKVLRCTEQPGENIMTDVGYERAEQFARESPGCHLFGSVPCTPWTNLQNLNLAMHGEPFRKKLAEDRAESIRLIGRFIRLARIVHANGGTISFDWPTSSNGWTVIN